MRVKVILELKPLANDSNESARIYSLTRESIERLNNYVADFVETINILKENQVELKKSKKKNKKDVKEIDKSIEYMKSKIDDVYKSMQEIVEDMPFLVELKEFDIVDGEDNGSEEK